ncbi:MAG: glycosyltransferase [Candidatus Paceibacterota bacterium]|jgi:glycosyltransferase involved in cell wall biosynthesis
MISIIIPTLNEEKILDKTLSSLKKLTNYDYEIIVSDGYSTDKTVEIAKKYTNKIIVHDGKTRQTIGEGRNLGATIATGDFLVFMDADCLIINPNDFFQSALNYFQKNKSLVAFAPSIKVLPEFATRADKIFSYLINLNYQINSNVFHIGAAPGEFQMIKKTAFIHINGYNKKLVTGEDVDFFQRLSKIGKVKFKKDLIVWHTGRRAHKIGWPRLLSLYFINTIGIIFKGKSLSKEWKPIR